MLMPLPGSVQGQVGKGFVPLGLVEGVPAHGRGVGRRWSLRSLLTQTILWFYENIGPLQRVSSLFVSLQLIVKILSINTNSRVHIQKSHMVQLVSEMVLPPQRAASPFKVYSLWTEEPQTLVIIGLRNLQVTGWWFSASYLPPSWNFQDLVISIFESLHTLHN